MINVDIKKEELKEKVSQALRNGNIEEQADIVKAFIEQIAKETTLEFTKETNMHREDNIILGSRGKKVLTSEENKYFEKLIEAMKSSNPKQALTEMDIVMPVTTIDRVFDDLETKHPLLKKITINNVTGLTEIITRKSDVDIAWWGPLTDKIKKELEMGFKKESSMLYKLTAFLPIEKAYLKLGPTWLESFVRKVIVEALSLGLVKGIVTGGGVTEPIGMDVDLDKAFTEGSPRTKKTPIKVKDFEPKTIGNIISKLTNNGKRTVTKVLMIVNPVDYWKKVYPSTTTKNPLGGYIVNDFPFPIEFIQEPSVSLDQAIIGISEKYDLNIGMQQKIEYDDSVRFLDDERVYVGRMYANGKPVDNNCFFILDISEINVEEPAPTPAV